MDMCRGRSARAGSRWIQGLSPSRSKVIMMAQRAPSGHHTGWVMEQKNRPRARGSQTRASLRGARLEEVRHLAPLVDHVVGGAVALGCLSGVEHVEPHSTVGLAVEAGSSAGEAGSECVVGPLGVERGLGVARERNRRPDESPIAQEEGIRIKDLAVLILVIE